MPTYPGNPSLDIRLVSSIASGASANVSQIRLGSHAGTHLDAPRHFFENGLGVDKVPLERLIGPAVVIDVSDEVRAIGAKELAAHDAQLHGHVRILMRTRNSRLLHENAFQRDYAFLAPDGASYLLERDFLLVGTDYLSVEEFRSGHHLTHRLLLDRQTAILEGLDLSRVTAGEYTLICLPLLLPDLDGAPARAILLADGSVFPAAGVNP